MIINALIYVYISLFIDGSITYNDENRISSNIIIVYLMYYESIFYLSYLCIYILMSIFYVIDTKDALTLAFIKLYNNLRTHMHNITLYELNHMFAISWFFTSPTIIKIFSSFTNIDLQQNVLLEYSMHALHIVYQYSLYKDINIIYLFIMMLSMYVIYFYNMYLMYKLVTPYKYVMLYGWIMIGLSETLYIVNIIDIEQHIVFKVINDMIVKGIIFGFFSFHEIINRYTYNKIELQHLQIMNAICNMITDDSNIILSQIKLKLMTIINSNNVLDESKREMSEMVYCKDFSNTFMRYILQHKSKEISGIFILFSDIVKYSEFCNRNDTQEIITTLDNIYKHYDKELSQYKCLQKIENIGDCYFITSKLDKEFNSFSNKEILNELFAFALNVVQIANELNITVRVGIHYGDVSVGIIGSNIPRFAVVGNDVNITARIESTCHKNNLHISTNVYNQLFQHNISHIIPFIKNKRIVYLKNIGEFTTYTIDPYDIIDKTNNIQILI